MPGWLQAFVNVNPITHLVAAVRVDDERRAGRVGHHVDRCCGAPASWWSSAP